MKLYTIISDVDGVEVSHYPSLEAAVKEWLSCMEECPQKERLQMEFDAKGAQAAIDESGNMDWEDYDCLWRDGREVVEVRDISDLPQVKQLVEALEGLIAQLDGPVMVHGDGRGRDGTKTGLSHQEFNELRKTRMAQAREALNAAKA